MLRSGEIKQYTLTEFTENRPDIIIKNKKEKTCTLIDVAIPADRNIMQKKAEKAKIQEFINRNTTNVKHKIYFVFFWPCIFV
jgi:hypothetical protein